MIQRALERMRDLVHSRRYVVTLHAADEAESDELTIFDVEHCILTGKIVGKQRERTTGENKYLIQGRTVSGEQAIVVGRIGAQGALVIITVYKL